jgi:hypothetical protein
MIRRLLITKPVEVDEFRWSTPSAIDGKSNSAYTRLAYQRMGIALAFTHLPDTTTTGRNVATGFNSDGASPGEQARQACGDVLVSHLPRQ